MFSLSSCLREKFVIVRTQGDFNFNFQGDITSTQKSEYTERRKPVCWLEFIQDDSDPMLRIRYAKHVKMNYAIFVIKLMRHTYSYLTWASTTGKPVNVFEILNLTDTRYKQ